MLWTVLPTTAAEALANQLIGLDDASPARLEKLSGKRLRVTLSELGKPFTLQVMSQQLLFSWVDTETVDCHVMTRLAVLPELRDTTNITRLIKADALDIDGDPMLAQQFAQLLIALDIDWQEQLATRIGDVPAHFLSQAFVRSRRWLEQALSDQQAWLRDVLVEEKEILVSRAEFTGFSSEVQQLRARLDKLERNLTAVAKRKTS